MHTVILSATHETKYNSDDREVPLPLVDIHKEKEPYLTTLLKRLRELSDLEGVCVVTNEMIKPQIDEWAAGLPPLPMPVRVLGDGTWTPKERRGAIGDLLFAIKEVPIQDDLLVVGGD